MVKKNSENISYVAAVSSTIAVLIVAVGMVGTALVRLFQDAPFHFMGLNFDVQVAAHSGAAELTIDPLALCAFLAAVFVCVFLSTLIAELLRIRRQGK